MADPYSFNLKFYSRKHKKDKDFKKTVIRNTITKGLQLLLFYVVFLMAIDYHPMVQYYHFKNHITQKYINNNEKYANSPDIQEKFIPFLYGNDYSPTFSVYSGIEYMRKKEIQREEERLKQKP